MNVFYDRYGTDTFDGMTIYDQSKFFIHINTDRGNNRDTPRGRFTLAHELGHYFIDSHRIGLKEGILEPHPSNTNRKQFFRIEREADFFASNLLMPEPRFRNALIGQKFSPEILNNLKLKFSVSTTACAFRFADIGNHPIMIVYAENKTIKWRHCSEDFKYKCLLYEKKISPNTVMGEFFNGVHNETYRTEKVWGFEVFSHIRTKDLNQMVNEYCVCYKNKAMSIFWFD